MKACYHSPVGILTITEENGLIKAVSFKEETLEANDNSPAIEKCKMQLDEYFAGNRKDFDLPLGQTGTDFQMRVWNALATIPYGKTTSYLALAKQLGDVKAIRAVGTANGRNNLAIIIPCHRVIGSDASLTGYAGGLWRKKWLLDHEAKHTYGLQRLFD
jgi:methylated-DNA-[protein]-cysteine S-methyltransferase